VHGPSEPGDKVYGVARLLTADPFLTPDKIEPRKASFYAEVAKQLCPIHLVPSSHATNPGIEAFPRLWKNPERQRFQIGISHPAV
jgi:hypothetical protein